jgi:hypothetical protein
MADDAQLPSQEVNRLRELIDAQFQQRASDASDTAVAFLHPLWDVLFGIAIYGPKLH